MTPKPVFAVPRRLTMRLIVTLSLTVLVLIAGIVWYLAPLNPNIVVLQFASTPQAFGEVIHRWPAEHLARYRAHLPLDFLLLLAYAALGYLVAARTALFGDLPAPLRRFSRWLLPLAAIFDAAENAFHWWLTAAPRFGVPLPYLLSAGCSGLKWVLLFAFGLLVLYVVVKDKP